jgi:hypothetical protein
VTDATRNDSWIWYIPRATIVMVIACFAVGVAIFYSVVGWAKLAQHTIANGFPYHNVTITIPIPYPTDASSTAAALLTLVIGIIGGLLFGLFF